MKVTLLMTGKTDAAWLQQGIDLYSKRLQHYVSFEFKVLPDLKNTRHLEAAEFREREARQLLPIISGKPDVYLLDEGGDLLSSRDLARFIEKRQLASVRELYFVIGGAYGFSEEVYQAAAGKISLSRMTFSHQMARLLFTEQLYRAYTIIKGEKYHND